MENQVNIITSPALFLPVSGSKILLIGPGQEWKELIRDYALDFPTQTSTSLYWSEDDDLTWMLYTANMVDHILVFLQDCRDVLYLKLISALAHRQNVHFSIVGDDNMSLILTTMGKENIEDPMVHFDTLLGNYV